MTDRTNFLTVVLDHEMRTDDVECIVKAISMVKGVAKVGVNVASPEEYFARQKASYDLRKKLIDALSEE